MQAGQTAKAEHAGIDPQATKQPQGARHLIGQVKRQAELGSVGPAGTARQGSQCAGQETAAAGQATSGARSRLARCQASAASSSNSSASFFIMVPPNSSASTMVTARR